MRMKNSDLFARSKSRYEQWDATAQRNADIKRRYGAGQPVEQIALHYSLSPNFVQRIVGAFE